MSVILQFLAKGISAFFLGHSLVSPTLPEMMQSVLDAPVEYTVINGAPLQILWNDSATAEGTDGRKLLSGQPVDAIILTERVSLASTMEWHASSDYATRWVGLAVAKNPETRAFMYQTWDDIDDAQSGTAQAWRARILSDLPLWQSIVDDVNRALPQMAHPMQIIPAGLGMVRLYDAIAAGKVPDSTSIRDFFTDNIHPNTAGFYYVTMIHYAMLTEKSPVGLPNELMGKYGPYPTVPKELARTLQELAQETAVAYRADQRPRAQP